ncbi:MAG: hypothetical protein HWE27_04340 [Gammaproteobacteria bacterium]|nr:hypothetical protein [Gammaproteobacteria bacterium]
MIWVVNILTVIVAIYYSIKLSNQKRAYSYSIFVIKIGISLHFLEAYFNSKSEKCEFYIASNFIEAIDSCIDYKSGSMILAQALILAGFTVLIVKLVIKLTSK